MKTMKTIFRYFSATAMIAVFSIALNACGSGGGSGTATAGSYVSLATFNSTVTDLQNQIDALKASGSTATLQAEIDYLKGHSVDQATVKTAVLNKQSFGGTSSGSLSKQTSATGSTSLGNLFPIQFSQNTYTVARANTKTIAIINQDASGTYYSDGSLVYEQAACQGTTPYLRASSVPIPYRPLGFVFRIGLNTNQTDPATYFYVAPNPTAQTITIQSEEVVSRGVAQCLDFSSPQSEIVYPITNTLPTGTDTWPAAPVGQVTISTP